MGILSAIGAIAPIVGGIFGSRSDRSANRAALAQAQMQHQFQVDQAHNQIQWRVADAQKAGIHPLYALGPTGMSYNPPAIVGGVGGDSWREMGQDISRAAMALMTQRERKQALMREILDRERQDRENAVQRERESILFDQQVRKNEIELQIDASRLARLNAPGTGVPYETAPPGAVETVPDTVRAPAIGDPSRSPGELTDYSFAHTPGGGMRIVPGADVKQRIEDMPSQWQWFLSNGIFPNAHVYRELERLHPAGPGMQWEYDALRGEFRRQRVGRPGRRLYERFIRPDLQRR